MHKVGLELQLPFLYSFLDFVLCYFQIFGILSEKNISYLAVKVMLKILNLRCYNCSLDLKNSNTIINIVFIV